MSFSFSAFICLLGLWKGAATSPRMLALADMTPQECFPNDEDESPIICIDIAASKMRVLPFRGQREAANLKPMPETSLLLCNPNPDTQCGTKEKEFRIRDGSNAYVLKQGSDEAIAVPKINRFLHHKIGFLFMTNPKLERENKVIVSEFMNENNFKWYHEHTPDKLYTVALFEPLYRLQCNLHYRGDNKVECIFPKSPKKDPCVSYPHTSDVITLIEYPFCPPVLRVNFRNKDIWYQEFIVVLLVGEEFTEFVFYRGLFGGGDSPTYEVLQMSSRENPIKVKTSVLRQKDFYIKFSDELFPKAVRDDNDRVDPSKHKVVNHNLKKSKEFLFLENNLAGFVIEELIDKYLFFQFGFTIEEDHILIKWCREKQPMICGPKVEIKNAVTVESVYQSFATKYI